MTSPSSTRFLHVANGTCTTSLIAAAGIPGTLSIWADPLYEGPVPGGLSDDELLDVRSRHLAGPDGADEVDPVNDLRSWRAVIERHHAYEELVLWFEHDLFDQLNLLQLLSWIRERVPAAKVVSLVCVDSFPGHPGFKGLGELSPGELASLLERRQRVSEEQYAVARTAWQAFREPTPEPLDALRRTNTSALPYLGASIERFLQEYPWTSDGLSRSERRLLELASVAPVDLSEAFRQMHDGEEVYYITDASLAELASNLSRTSPALLSFIRPRHPGAGQLEGVVALTEFGRAVLGGQKDRVASCGIDRWLGGVHLDRGAPWRWDDERGAITAN